MRKILLLLVPLMLLFFFYVGTMPAGASQKLTQQMHVNQDTVPPKDTTKFSRQDLSQIRYQAKDTVPKKDSTAKPGLLALN